MPSVISVKEMLVWFDKIPLPNSGRLTRIDLQKETFNMATAIRAALLRLERVEAETRALLSGPPAQDRIPILIDFTGCPDVPPAKVKEFVVMPSGDWVVKTEAENRENEESFWFDKSGVHPKSKLIFKGVPPAQELAAKDDPWKAYRCTPHQMVYGTKSDEEKDEGALKRLTEVIRKADHYRHVYLNVTEEEQLKEHGLDYAAFAHLRAALSLKAKKGQKT